MINRIIKRNIELIRRLVGNCIVIRVSDDTFQDNMMLADMNAQIQDICAVNNIYSLDRVRLSGKNGISISDIPKIKAGYDVYKHTQYEIGECPD